MFSIVYAYDKKESLSLELKGTELTKIFEKNSDAKSTEKTKSTAPDPRKLK